MQFTQWHFLVYTQTAITTRTATTKTATKTKCYYDVTLAEVAHGDGPLVMSGVKGKWLTSLSGNVCLAIRCISMWY